MRLEASSTCCNIDISKLKSNKFALVIRSIDRSGGGIWKIQTWNCICQPVDIDSYYNKIKLYRELGCKLRFWWICLLKRYLDFEISFCLCNPSGPFRPQSLLVFINPYGGRRQAEVIYYSSVRPILDLVGIRSKVIGKLPPILHPEHILVQNNFPSFFVVTTHQGHCQEYVLSEDLSPYDGYVESVSNSILASMLAYSFIVECLGSWN